MNRCIGLYVVPFALLLLDGGLMAQTPLFTPRADYPAESANRSAIADFNGDGKPDIAVPGSSGGVTGVYMLLAHPTLLGTFQPPVFLPLGHSPTILAAGDFDRDGKMDLLSKGQSGNGIVFFKGNGNGTFQSGAVIASGGAANSNLKVADLNGDGILDFVTTANIRVFLGHGDGTFAAPVLYLNGCNAATDDVFALGDFNGDNRIDAVTPCFNGTANLAFLPGNGDGTFGAPVFFGAGAYDAVVSGDFDGDGRLDIVATSENGFADFFKGNGNGTFQAAQRIPALTGTLPIGLAVADVNFDGRLDLLTAYDKLRVFPGMGDGTFGPAVEFPIQLPSTPEHFVPPIADLNGDGAPDVVIQGADRVSVFLGTPPSLFLSASQNPIVAGQKLTLTAVVASPATGVLYPAGGTVQFSSGLVLGPPVPLINGQAVFNTSSLTEGVHTVQAGYFNNSGALAAPYVQLAVSVTKSLCANDVSSQVSIAPGGFRLDRVTNQFIQTVTITNTSATAISGPLSLALGSLSSNATLINQNGATVCSGQQRGMPYADSGICLGMGLLPGNSVQFDLRFSNPTRQVIQYTPMALGGNAPR